MTTTTHKAPKVGPRPEWAKALIVAEFETNESDTMTDYFATRTRRTVPLAWSKHTRDLFSEMRKAAALFESTAHLGPGCGVFTVRIVTDDDIKPGNGSALWKGSYSPWHREDEPETSFTTRAEAEAFIASKPKPHTINVDGTLATFSWTIEETKIEHREKYSMGHGYYLKGSDRYSSGWVVRKLTHVSPDDINEWSRSEPHFLEA